MKTPEEWRKRLVARMRELDERLAGIEEELDEPADRDLEEQAIEREDDEVLESLGKAGQKELGQIRAALARIDAGTFGICVVCGEPIAEERLNVVPYATKCQRCA